MYWCIFDRLDVLNRSWPFIFIGRDGLIPLGVENLINSVSKYNFYTDSTDQKRSDRPCQPVWPDCPGCRSSESHISLIRTPNWTFYIWILIYSTRAIQWWSLFCILNKFTRPVWPVWTRGLAGSPCRANFGHQQLSRRWQRLAFKIIEASTLDQ